MPLYYRRFDHPPDNSFIEIDLVYNCFLLSFNIKPLTVHGDSYFFFSLSRMHNIVGSILRYIIPIANLWHDVTFWLGQVLDGWHVNGFFIYQNETVKYLELTAMSVPIAHTEPVDAN